MSAPVVNTKLPSDTFKVRWRLSVEGLAKIKQPGQEVKVIDLVEKEKVKIGSKEVTIQGLVKTSIGLIPISYLEPKIGQASTKLEKKILETNPVNGDVAVGRWWLGRISPIEAGLLMARDPALTMGSYAVCQPPETDPLTNDKWAEFLLVVRNISGSVNQWIYEWNTDNDFNQRFGKKFKMRKIGYDIICGPTAAPMPPIAYYVIKRTSYGMFYIDKSNTFSSIDLLLSHYYTNALPLNGETNPDKQSYQLALRGVMNFDLPSHTFPRPMLGKMSKPEYLYGQRSPIKLILECSNKRLRQYKPRIADLLLLYDVGENEALYRSYLHYNGAYNTATIRKIRTRLFNKKAFDKDIARLKEVEQFSKDNLSKLEKGNIRNGYGFLTHIIGFGFEKNADYRHWIAYEFIPGISLEICLQRRRYYRQTMSLRQKSEIMYQVCAGMRFLELNGLCHRHLRASNIVVHQTTNYMDAVKITDYMVPYHFLDKDAVQQVNLCDLDWPWFAPECLLQRTFNIVSDVWAFGCVIFELNHDGLGPYTHNSPQPQTAMDLQTMFTKGEKIATLNKEGTKTFLDDVFLMCTNYKAQERPTFDYMFKFFRDLLFDFAVGPKAAIEYLKKPNPPKQSSVYKKAKTTKL